MDAVRLAARLRRTLRGEVHFDALARARFGPRTNSGRTAPTLGVVVPADEQDLLAIVELAREHGAKVRPTGARTYVHPDPEQPALLVDTSACLRQVLDVDVANRRAVVQTGVSVQALNRRLAPHGLHVPLELARAEASVGGVISTNARGLSLLGAGCAVHWLEAVEALLADGTGEFFGPFGPKAQRPMGSARTGALVSGLFELSQRHRHLLRQRLPTVEGAHPELCWDAFVARRPRALTPDGSVNLGHLFAGAQGRLGLIQRVHLRLAPLPQRETTLVLGWASLARAVEAVTKAQAAGAWACELLDARTGDWPQRASARAGVQWWTCVSWQQDAAPPDRPLGDFLERLDGSFKPMAHILDQGEEAHACKAWRIQRFAQWWGAEPDDSALRIECALDRRDVSRVVDAILDRCAQSQLTMQAMGQASQDGVQLYLRITRAPGNASFTIEQRRELSAWMAQHCIALGGTCELVSGHGLSLMERNTLQWGEPLLAATGEAHRLFDPGGLFACDVAQGRPAYPVIAVALAPALEPIQRCTGHASCLTLEPDHACPSFPLRHADIESPRGRLRTLQALAQRNDQRALGEHEQARAAMDWCVGCKACRSSCSEHIDMAQIKHHLKTQWHAKHGWTLRDRVFAYLPRYGRLARHVSALINLRNRSAILRWLAERLFGLSAETSWPVWHRHSAFHGRLGDGPPQAYAGENQVVLWADTLNDLFEPSLLEQAEAVLRSAGLHVHRVGKRCCGASFYAQGMDEQARREVRATLDALAPWLEHEVPIVVIEPACKAMLSEQAVQLVAGTQSEKLARLVTSLEALLLSRADQGKLDGWLARLKPPSHDVHVQGHCHQKAEPDWQRTLRFLARIPGLRVHAVQGACCGMAGSFGLEREHAAVASAMAHQAILPTIQAAATDVAVLSTGSSCRQHLGSLAQRKLLHPIGFLHAALPHEEFPQGQGGS